MIADLGWRWIVAFGVSALLALAVPTWLLWPVSAPITEQPALKPVVFRLRPAAPLALPFAHPLFNPDRTLLAEATATPEAAAAPPAPPPVLLGVVARRGGGGVALVRDEAGKPRSLRIGEILGPWRLLDVTRNGAVFINGAERTEVRLSYDRSATAGAAAGPASPAGTALAMPPTPAASPSTTPPPPAAQ